MLGAGLAGLSAAHHLGGRCEVFEKEPARGGHSRTHRVDGFNFDEGAHVFFGKDECSEQFVWQPLAGELIHHRAEIWNNYGGRSYGRYPVQANAHALPPELATQCLLDFVEVSRRGDHEVRNYRDWCYASFGRAFADNFMLRYARKVWTVEPEELTTEWLGTQVGGRISRPSLEQVVRGAIDRNPQEVNYLTTFAYPAQGGFGRIADPVAEGAGEVHLCQGVVRVETGARSVTLSDGTTRRYVALVSTVPLPDLVRMVSEVPVEVCQAADRLMWTSLRLVNVGVRHDKLGPGHWVYFYDEQIPFFRLSFPHKLSPGNAPPGMGSISCEIAYSRRRPLDGREAPERVIEALAEVGILRSRDEVLFVNVLDVPYAYVVFDFNRAKSLEAIHSWMLDSSIFPCGRFGEWGYHWSFEAIESGRRVAAAVTERLALVPLAPRDVRLPSAPRRE